MLIIDEELRERRMVKDISIGLSAISLAEQEVMMGRAGICYECNFLLPPNRENLISFIHHALYYLEYSWAHLARRVSCFCPSLLL